MQHLQNGELRLIVCTATDAASARFPTVPTFDEFMPNTAVAPAWLGLLRPKILPSEIVAKISADLRTVALVPDFAEQPLQGSWYRPSRPISSRTGFSGTTNIWQADP